MNTTDRTTWHKIAKELTKGFPGLIQHIKVSPRRCYVECSILLNEEQMTAISEVIRKAGISVLPGVIKNNKAPFDLFPDPKTGKQTNKLDKASKTKKLKAASRLSQVK